MTREEAVYDLLKLRTVVWYGTEKERRSSVNSFFAGRNQVEDFLDMIENAGLKIVKA